MSVTSVHLKTDMKPDITCLFSYPQLAHGLTPSQNGTCQCASILRKVYHTVLLSLHQKTLDCGSGAGLCVSVLALQLLPRQHRALSKVFQFISPHAWRSLPLLCNASGLAMGRTSGRSTALGHFHLRWPPIGMPMLDRVLQICIGTGRFQARIRGILHRRSSNIGPMCALACTDAKLPLSLSFSLACCFARRMAGCQHGNPVMRAGQASALNR